MALPVRCGWPLPEPSHSHQTITNQHIPVLSNLGPRLSDCRGIKRGYMGLWRQTWKIDPSNLRYLYGLSIFVRSSLQYNAKL